jgi:hypothetical protein
MRQPLFKKQRAWLLTPQYVSGLQTQNSSTVKEKGLTSEASIAVDALSVKNAALSGMPWMH